MKRFELLRGFWPLRDFQSRALDQLGDISIWSISFFAILMSIISFTNAKLLEDIVCIHTARRTKHALGEAWKEKRCSLRRAWRKRGGELVGGGKDNTHNTEYQWYEFVV